jgi:hypothetical protein
LRSVASAIQSERAPISVDKLAFYPTNISVKMHEQINKSRLKNGQEATFDTRGAEWEPAQEQNDCRFHRETKRS